MSSKITKHKKLKVGVVGATGFTGEKLVEILLNHPQADITYLSAIVEKPTRFSSIFPRFKGKLDLPCGVLDVEKACRKADLLFLSLPHRVSFRYAPLFLKKNKLVVDLSADYRLKDLGVYKQYYGVDHKDKKNVAAAVYGLPEFFKKEIKKAQLIANPGCYPTVALLSVAPLLKENVVDKESIIIDAKTGITGAGRKGDLAYHYAHLNQNVSAYKVFGHQHLPEINQVLSQLTNKKIAVQFTPHLLPMERGILITAYGKLIKKSSQRAIKNVYKKYYAQSPFVRVFDHLPHLKDVIDTNFCDVGFSVQKERIVVVGCLDNLIKGASGQAVQNMNIMCSFKETEGLG